MNCPHCGSSSFRTSRFRTSDLARLLLFQFPVRCRSCRERNYAGFILAMNFRQADKVRHQNDSNRKGKKRSHGKSSHSEE